MVVGGGLKYSGTDGTREYARFVVLSEWWWDVDLNIVGQMEEEEQ
jgi:hypothetical protein